MNEEFEVEVVLAPETQEFLPEEVRNEIFEREHTLTLTAKCHAFGALGTVIQIGMQIAAQTGMVPRESLEALHNALEPAIAGVEPQHIAGLHELKARFPEAFAKAEADQAAAKAESARELDAMKGMFEEAA